MNLSFYFISTKAHAVIGVLLALVTIAMSGIVTSRPDIVMAWAWMFIAAAANVANVSLLVAGRRASRESAS